MHASVWKRLFAFLIDAFVFAVLFWVLAQVLSNFTVSLVLLVLIWLYYALLESSPLQASLGKLIMGIKVVDSRGRRLSFVTATKRLLARIYSNMMFYVSFFSAGSDKRKRALHAASHKSHVIKKNIDFNPDDFAEPEEHALTMVTITSAILALLFVVLLLAVVVLPQYEKIGDRVEASDIIAALNRAAANRPVRLAKAVKGQERWVTSYVGCLSNAKDPLTLDCNGFSMTLTPGGIVAESRLADWSKYALFKEYETGKISCSSDVASGQKFCQSLHLEP